MTALFDFSRRIAPADDLWQACADRIDAHAVDLNDKSQYNVLKDLPGKESEKSDAQIFYLAIPPSLFGSVADGLASAG